MAGNPFDQFDTATSSNPFDQFDEKPAGNRSFLGASAESGGRSLLSTGARIADALNPFTTSDEEAATLFKNDPEGFKNFQARGAAGALSRFAREQAARAESVMKDVTPDATGAVSGKPLGELEYATMDPEKAAYLSPTRVAGDVLRSLPSTLALAVAGYLTRGRSLQAAEQAEAAALASGASAEVAKKAGRDAAVTVGAETMAKTSAIGEGAVGAGQQYDQALDEAMKVKPEVYEASPDYQALLEKGYDPEMARIALAHTVARNAAGSAGAVDALTNAAGGAVLGRVIGEGGKLVPRIAKGVGTEAVTETVQSAGEQAGQNLAMRAVNPGQELGEGVREAAVAGGVVGGVTGGAAAGVFGRPSPRRQVAEEQLATADNVSDMVAAATELAGTLPEIDNEIRAYLPTPSQIQPVPAESVAPAPQPEYEDLSPMTKLQAQQRLVVLRDQATDSGVEYAVVAHPASPKAFAIERARLPTYEVGAPAAPELTGPTQPSATDAPTAPPASAVVAAMRTEPFLRDAAQKTAIQTAAARLSPEDQAIVDKAAKGPFALSIEERNRLTVLNDGIKMSPARAQETLTAEAAKVGGTATIVNPASLPSVAETQQRTDGTQSLTKEVHGLVERVGKIFKKNIVLFDSKELSVDGFVREDDPDTIYLNVKASKPHLVLLGHEVTHQMKQQLGHAYTAFEQVVRAGLTKEGAAAHTADYGASANLEELSADLMGNRFHEPEFWGDVFAQIEKNLGPKAAVGVVQRLGALISKAVQSAKRAVFNASGFKADEFVNNLDDVKKAARTALAEYAANRREAMGEQPRTVEGKYDTPSKPSTGRWNVIADNVPTREDAERMTAARAKSWGPAYDFKVVPSEFHQNDSFQVESRKRTQIGNDRTQIENNASGESAASAEAQSRLRDETAKGRDRVLVDRDGTVRPLVTADRVDQRVRAGQVLLQRGVGKNEWTVLDAGPGSNKAAAIERAKSWSPTPVRLEQAQELDQLDSEFSLDNFEPSKFSPKRAPGELPVVKPRFRAPLAAAAKGLTADEIALLREDTATKMVKTIVQLPETDEMAAIAWAGRAKRGWYKGSTEALITVFGADAPRFAALLAALSPQTGVESNLLNALQVWRAWDAAGRPQAPKAIRRIIGANVQGDKGEKSILHAWFNNSMSALTAEDPAAVTYSGPKVNSFFQNLTGNVNEVTNDTWMANYALMSQSLFAGRGRLINGKKVGLKGYGYMAMNSVVRQAAARLTELTGETWSPAEVQETVWSWAKALYEAQKNGQTASDILYNEELTDELINATPDFRTLFHDNTYARIIEAAGLGEQLGHVHAETAERAAAARDEGQTAPFDSSTQARFEQQAAKRLEELKAVGKAGRDKIMASTRRRVSELPLWSREETGYGLRPVPAGALKDSAESAFDRFAIVPGVRQVPIADVRLQGTTLLQSDAELERIENLAAQIKKNGAIEPVFVGMNTDGELYLMEGQHRARALRQLGETLMPARFVIDETEGGTHKRFYSGDEENQARFRASTRRPISVTGIHYSQQPRTTLLSSMYGTGLKGAERERGAGPRIHFYLDTGNGVKPEAGVGGYAHTAQLSNLYDMAADTQYLAADAKGLADFEKRVTDDGYDGYFDVNFRTDQGAAVLLGDHTVPAEPAGQGALPPSGETIERATREDTGFRAVLAQLAAAKDLPSGALTPARWLEVLPAEIGQPLRDAGVLEGTEPLYKNELAQAYKAAVANAPLLNVGLSTAEVKGGGENGVDAVTAEIKKIVPVLDVATHKSDTEMTAVVAIARPLTEEEANELSATLSQEAIVQRMPDGSGEMFGPKATEWGPYNGEYFVMPDGTRADAVKASTRRQTETPEFKKWFGDSKVVDGTLKLPGVTADVVATRGQGAAIYGWTGDKTGKTREALRLLRAFGGTVEIHDPGAPGTASRAYWDKMQGEGLVDTMFDADGDGTKASPRRIVGDSGRTYTPAQKKMFSNTGRTVDVPTFKDRLTELRKDLGKKMAQGVADQFAPVKDITEKGYMLMRLSKGSSGAVEAFLHHGKLEVTSEGVYNADTSGGFIERLGVPLHGELEDFLWWVAANRSERLAAEGRENLFSAQDIAAGKSLAEGKTEFDYTLRNGKVTRDRSAIFADALKTFDEFNKNAMDVAEKSGLIDPEARKIWEHEFYVPFYRVSEDDRGFVGGNVKSGVVRQRAFNALKGGTDKLNSDLLSNTLQNWAHLIDASAKNRAAEATLEAAVNLGIATEADADTVRQMARASGSRNSTVWFMDGGKERHFVVGDPYLLTALNGLEFAGLKGPLMDALSSFKHWLTVGVTASPAFKIRNLIRDSVQAVAVAPLSYNVLGNLKEGFEASKRGTQPYVSALASGGLIRFGTMLEGRASDRVRQLVRMGVDESTILDSEDKITHVRNQAEKLFMAYSEIGNRGEEINRSALYQQMLKQGFSQGEAALAARDLLDFSMQGAWTSVRFFTQVVPFMNARIQGLYKLGKAAKEDPKRFAVVLGATALMSLSLLAMYHDDDDWKKREDWDRDNYWWFKIGGTAYRIPKPFEVGAIATLAERGVELFTDKEMTSKRFLQRVKQLVLDNLSMNPFPQAGKPLLDIYSNKDSFSGRPIETMGMERLRPDYRFTAGTSMPARAISTAGQVAAEAVGGNFMSPVQVDHLIRGYLGWLGSFAVGGADMVIRPLTKEPTRPTADYYKLASMGFVSEVPERNSRYVSQLYEQSKELDQAYTTWKNLAKQGKAAEAREFLEDNRDAIVRSRRFGKVKTQEALLNDRIRMVERSTMTPDEKKAELRRLAGIKDRLARTVAPGG